MLPAMVGALTLAANADAVVIPLAFARWRQLAKDTKSLAVEFTVSTSDRSTDRVAGFDGTLRLLRTETDTLAKLVLRNRETKDRFECVLRDGRYHLPAPAEKVLLSYKPDTVLPTAAGFFTPLLAALWAEKPDELFSLKVSKREQFYTHLDYVPKDKDVRTEAERGRVVIVHRTNDTLPVGVPRQLWHDVPGGQKRVTLEIQKWEMNGKNPPTVGDFAVPTEKDGWKVTVTGGFWNELRKRRTDK
jgi:hypothetical protein